MDGIYTLWSALRPQRRPGLSRLELLLMTASVLEWRRWNGRALLYRDEAYAQYLDRLGLLGLWNGVDTQTIVRLASGNPRQPHPQNDAARVGQRPGDSPGHGTAARPAVPYEGQLAAGLCADAYADGLAFDFVAGDEVYGASPDLRAYLESRGQAYVLRVASNFPLTLADGMQLTCAQAVKTLLKGRRPWEVRSAGQGSKGQRW